MLFSITDINMKISPYLFEFQKQSIGLGICLFFSDRTVLCNPGQHQTQNPPTYASQVLQLQAHDTTPHQSKDYVLVLSLSSLT